MDLWDLTKLLFRRWYFALPMMLTAVALMVLTMQGVSPDYKSKGHLQMIPPPSLGKPVSTTGPSRPHNPWLDLGYQALGNAALLKVTDPPVLERLAKEGYAPSVTVTLAERLPLLEIEAVGSSEAQATATVREIIKLLADDILTEQKQYGVATEDTITTLTLNDGANVEVVTSKVKRAIVVAGGVGMLVTVGGTIGLDALLRRRSRRRLGMDAADLSSPPPAPAEPEARRRQVGEDAAPARTPRLLSGLTLPSTAGRGRAQSSGAVEPKMPQAPPQPAAKPPKPPVSRPIRTPSGEVSLTMEYRQSAEPTSVLPDPSAEDDAGTTALPVDATIVLPLPHATHWPRRDGRTNGR